MVTQSCFVQIAVHPLLSCKEIHIKCETNIVVENKQRRLLLGLLFELMKPVKGKEEENALPMDNRQLVKKIGKQQNPAFLPRNRLLHVQ